MFFFKIILIKLDLRFFFKLISFFINFLIWLLKKNLNADVALKKYQIIFLNNILMATSAPHQQVGHSIYHVEGFRWLVDGKDDFKNEFLFLGMKFPTKSILGPK